MANSTLFTLFMTFLIIMDPLGNVGSFLAMTKNVVSRRLPYVVFREMLIALAAMIGFYLISNSFFRFLQLSETAVWCSSGLILFLTAIKILFPSTNSLRSNLPEEEPFIVPFAIPLIAGPSLLATIMLYAHMESCRPMVVTAILLAWMCAVTLLLLAPKLKSFLGTNGLIACERLTGMVLVMMAIQRFMEGVRLFIEKHA